MCASICFSHDKVLFYKPIIFEINFIDLLLTTTIPIAVMILTVASISLTLKSDLTYGITFSELEEIRKEVGFCMSFGRLCITFISISILALIFTFFKYYITAIYFVVIIYIFAFYICIEEIPLYYRNSKKVLKYLKEYCIQARKNNFATENKILLYRITFVLLDKIGIKDLNDILKEEKKDKDNDVQN